jgi:hypothetical protein
MRSSLAARDFLLPKALKKATLASTHRESGECAVKREAYEPCN